MSQTLSMRVSKHVIIEFLKCHPDDLVKIAPFWGGTTSEYIAALEAAPGEYFVGGVLEMIEEDRA